MQLSETPQSSVLSVTCFRIAHIMIHLTLIPSAVEWDIFIPPRSFRVDRRLETTLDRIFLYKNEIRF